MILAFADYEKMASGLVVCTTDEGLVGDGPKLLECASVLKMSFEFTIV